MGGIGLFGPRSCLPFPPQMTKWPHLAQLCQVLPGTQQGNTPGRIFSHLQLQFAGRRTPLSRLTAHCPGSGIIPCHHGNGHCTQAHWPLPSPSSKPSPSGGSKHKIQPFIKGDLSEENHTLHSQEEAQGRSCN